MSSSPQKLAYVAEGKLYLHNGAAGATAAESTLVDSPFVQSIFDRLARSRDRNAWKSQSAGWDLQGGGFMGMRGVAGAGKIAPAETRRILFTGVSPGKDGHLVYSLDTDHAGGLFAMDPADQSERRLFHRQHLRARDVSTSPADGSLAVSLHKEDGTAHLAIMGPEGRGLKEITEGDAIDEAPSWVGDAASGKTLVFQSAGIGRNAAGAFVALGPYAVQELDLASEKVTTLLEDVDFDYLLPRMPDGKTLYCIRRPYEPHGKPASALKVGLDVLLFPFRVIRALVHFLNFMSLMFARKPIMTAGGPPREGADQRFIMLWGRVIDAETALKKKQPDGALVPKEWELIRKTGDSLEVLAQGVAAYDVAPNGNVIWTNGSVIYSRGVDGKQELVCKGKMIERVAVLGR